MTKTVQAHQAPALVTVDVAPALDQAIMHWKDYSGRLEAIDLVEIRPLVSGTLTTVHFEDGGSVKQGDRLFTIDPRPYAINVDRATAQLSHARAHVALTALELARAQRLLAENAIAKRDVEAKQYDANQAKAQAQTAQATLNAAQLELSHTEIISPIAGRVSRAAQTMGNIVDAGASSMPLTTVVSVAKMYATFDVDETTYLQRLNTAQPKNRPIPVLLNVENDKNGPRKGIIQSIDNRINVASGTIRVRAIFDNTDGQLTPGMYARIRLGHTETESAVVVDERAIGTDQGKRYVLVVDPQGQTTYREVQLGANYDDLRQIKQGLLPGELVVVNGLQRIRPGETISPNLVSMGSPVTTASTDTTLR